MTTPDSMPPVVAIGDVLGCAVVHDQTFGSYYRITDLPQGISGNATGAGFKCGQLRALPLTPWPAQEPKDSAHEREVPRQEPLPIQHHE